MKVYVVKNKYNKKSNGYMTETGEFINSIWQAELFNDYETAKCYAPALCQVVECELMEITELSNYTKQVRKEVCDEIRKQLVYYPVSLLDEAGKVKDNVWGISMKDLTEILDQTKGVKNE